jgi:hypothetical protein
MLVELNQKGRNDGTNPERGITCRVIAVLRFSPQRPLPKREPGWFVFAPSFAYNA